MNNKAFSDYTEIDFLNLVRGIFNAGIKDEEEHINDLEEFERVSEHPSSTDLIYYPENDTNPTPESVVLEVKEWRNKNGMPGFKNACA